jgi:hypothetical protein
MPMGMPYPKGNMAMKKGKMSMSEMMGVEKKVDAMESSDKKMPMKAKGGGKKLPAFMMKKK